MKAEYDFSEGKRGAVIPQTGKTIMNEALREYLHKTKQPLDEETLRRIIQEELRAVVPS
jgi:hypothetical protein